MQTAQRVDRRTPVSHGVTAVEALRPAVRSERPSATAQLADRFTPPQRLVSFGKDGRVKSRLSSTHPVHRSAEFDREKCVGSCLVVSLLNASSKIACRFAFAFEQRNGLRECPFQMWIANTFPGWSVLLSGRGVRSFDKS